MLILREQLHFARRFLRIRYRSFDECLALLSLLQFFLFPLYLLFNTLLFYSSNSSGFGGKLESSFRLALSRFQQVLRTYAVRFPEFSKQARIFTILAKFAN